MRLVLVSSGGGYRRCPGGYDGALLAWMRARDVIAGEDAVKSADGSGNREFFVSLSGPPKETV
jgi:hypothetical protein